MLVHHQLGLLVVLVFLTAGGLLAGLQLWRARVVDLTHLLLVLVFVLTGAIAGFLVGASYSAVMVAIVSGALPLASALLAWAMKKSETAVSAGAARPHIDLMSWRFPSALGVAAFLVAFAVAFFIGNSHKVEAWESESGEIVGLNIRTNCQVLYGAFAQPANPDPEAQRLFENAFYKDCFFKFIDNLPPYLVFPIVD